MLQIVRSNRAEALVGHLGTVLAEGGDPFAAELVAVPSAGMRRWVEHRLADRLGAVGGRGGICAGITFTTPGALVDDIVARVLGEQGADPWQPEALAFALLEDLDDLCATGECAALARHLRDERGAPVSRRRYGLARAIADLLDRYALHRSELLAAWARMEDPDVGGDGLAEQRAWQAAAYWAAQRRLATPDPTRRRSLAVQALGSGSAPDLPPRVAVLGVAGLPREHLRLLAAASEHTDVHLCVLAATAVAPDQVDHPLLAGLGAHGMELAAALKDDVASLGVPVDVQDTWVEPDPSTEGDLAAVQASVLHGSAPPEPEATPEPGIPPVQVHACAGATRQVEALRDAILELLAADATLQPSDILVICPDVASFAPLVAAVLGDAGGQGLPRIPHTLADRSLGEVNPIAAVLAAVLDLSEGRVTAPEVVDLLAAPPVAERFGFGRDELDRIRMWLTATGVRWGLDARHRADSGGQGGANTWRAGLDRILLGVAMADDDERSFGGVVPLDEVEGDGVELAGRLADAVEALRAGVTKLRGRRTPAQWRTVLTGVVDDLCVAEGDGVADRAAVVGLLDGLVAAATTPSGSPRDVTLGGPEVRSVLRTRLLAPAGSGGHRAGGVTVTGPLALRGVPHRVVCLLGADDGVLPRSPQPPAWDLLAADPVAGDPDPRGEDRQMVLDALLASRGHLVICHTGRDPRTGEILAPAGPVSELVEGIEAVLGPAAIRWVDHPLTSFSPRVYGVEPRTGQEVEPLSYDRRMVGAAQALLGAQGPPRPLLDADLDDDEVELLTIPALVGALTRPAQYLLAERLSVRLPEDVAALDDRDPDDPMGLARWRHGTDLLKRMLDGEREGLDRALEVALARGDLPAGTPGRHALAAVRGIAEQIADAARPLREAEAREVAVDVPVDLGEGRTVRVTGRVTVHDATVVDASFSRLSETSVLRPWIHLVCAAVADPDGVRAARVVGRDSAEAGEATLLAPQHVAPLHVPDPSGRSEGGDVVPMDPAGVLADLVRWALVARRRAVVLTPDVLCAVAKADARATDEEHREHLVHRAVAEVWAEGDPYLPNVRGVLDDPTTQLVLGHLDADEVARDPDVRAAAIDVWAPLLAARAAGDAAQKADDKARRTARSAAGAGSR